MANYSSSHSGAEIDSAVGRLKSTAVTAGTVVASSGVCVDSNKDITGFRNITLTGQLTAATISLTGDTDIGDAVGDTVTITAQVDSNVVPSADNTYDLGSSTKEWKDIYIDGTAYLDAINFNGTAITSTAAELNILDGVTSTAAELNILDGVTSTATELNIMDGGTSATSTTLADADRVVVNDDGTMKQVALTDFETYFESALDTLSNVTSVGTLTSLTVADTADIDLSAVSDIIHTSTSTNSTAGHHIFKSYNTEIMRIDGASNRVGIGNTSPDGTLHIQTATAGSVTPPSTADDLVIEGSTTPGVSILMPNNGVGRYGFGVVEDNDRAYMSYSHDAEKMFFGVGGADRMTITAGNVGIGVDDPTNTVHIRTVTNNDGLVVEEVANTNSNPKIKFKKSAASGGAITSGWVLGQIEFQGAGASSYGYHAGADIFAITSGTIGDGRVATDLVFRTAPDSAASVAEAMRITSAGNVGIGTTSPATALHAESASNAVITWKSTDGSNTKTYHLANDATRAWMGSSDTSIIQSWTPEGLVGIGTASPNELLHIYNSSQSWDAHATIRMSSESDSYASEIGFHRGTEDDNDRGLFLSGNGSTKHMLVKHNGNVGIGTATPGNILDCRVSSSGNYVGAFYNTPDTSDAYGIKVQCGQQAGTGTTYFFKALESDAGDTGDLRTVSGTFQLSDNSDSRLKNNIRDTEVNGLDTVNSMKVRDFEWKKNKSTVLAGFVAQELKESFEPASPDDEDAVDAEGNPIMMALSRERLVPVLVKAIQELTAKVEALEAK